MENENLIEDVVELFLADYRFEASADDLIVNEWTELDLSPLSPGQSLVLQSGFNRFQCVWNAYASLLRDRQPRSCDTDEVAILMPMV